MTLRRRSETPRCRICRQRWPAKAWERDCPACVQRKRDAEAARRHAQSLAAVQMANDDTQARRALGLMTESRVETYAPQPKGPSKLCKLKAATTVESHTMTRTVELGCIVCQRPAELHHITVGGRRLSHSHVIPLCPPHHRTGEMGVTPRHSPGGGHGGRVAFEAAYGTEQSMLDRARDALGMPRLPLDADRGVTGLTIDEKAIEDDAA